MKCSLKWPKKHKSGKWGLAETPSPHFRLELGQRNFAYPTYQGPVYKSALRTLAASTNRSEDIADFHQKSRFLGVFRRRFSRLSPHPVQSGKSHLLSILIIYRYIHARQVSGKSYGNFRRSVLKSLIIGIVWAADCWGLGVGPFPLLDCQNPLKKRRPPRMTARVASRASLSTKGGRPRPPTVRRAWSNWYCGPFDLALAPLRCAPLRLSAMTYGGPLVCRLYYFLLQLRIGLMRHRNIALSMSSANSQYCVS